MPPFREGGAIFTRNNLHTYTLFEFPYFVLAVNEDDCFDPDRHAAPVVMAVMGPAKHLFLAKLLSK